MNYAIQLNLLEKEYGINEEQINAITKKQNSVKPFNLIIY